MGAVVVIVVFFVCRPMGMRGDHVVIQNVQRTGRFDIFIFVICRFSRAVEFIVDLGAVGKIGKSLAQRRADAWLGLGRDTDILFQ